MSEINPILKAVEKVVETTLDPVNKALTGSTETIHTIGDMAQNALEEVKVCVDTTLDRLPQTR
jgi:hypothetical protein